MATIEEIVERMRRNPRNVRFSELSRVCEQYFGEQRQGSTSHKIYRTPWHGDPRVNIQNDKGKAKAYQVKQVIKAIERLNYENHSE